MQPAYIQHMIYHDEVQAIEAASFIECDDGESIHVLTNPKTGASWIIEVRDADGQHIMFV